MSALRTLVLASEIFSGGPPGVDVDLLQQRPGSRRCWLPDSPGTRRGEDTPVTAALLADVGLLVPGIDVRGQVTAHVSALHVPGSRPWT